MIPYSILIAFPERYCDKNIFGPWIPVSQGKLFKKNQVMFFQLVIETCGSKLSFYRNIFLPQYCVQKYLVCIGPNTEMQTCEISEKKAS